MDNIGKKNCFNKKRIMPSFSFLIWTVCMRKIAKSSKFSGSIPQLEFFLFFRMCVHVSVYVINFVYGLHQKPIRFWKRNLIFGT